MDPCVSKGHYFFELKNRDPVKTDNKYNRWFKVIARNGQQTDWIGVNYTLGDYFEQYYGQEFTGPPTMDFITWVYIASDYNMRILEDWIPEEAKVIEKDCHRIIGWLYCEVVRYADLSDTTRGETINGNKTRVEKCWNTDESDFPYWGARRRKYMAQNTGNFEWAD
ncbi:uncharacterized protein LOC142340187 isoform X2 [Convolutriloba macropyga]